MNVSSSVDEIEQIVKDWYADLGQPIPDTELVFIQAYRDQEREHQPFLWNGPLPDAPESMLPASKPVYGTPAFWKDWWAKKKAKEKAAAERAANGEVEELIEKVKKLRISKKKT
jgi:hypothetical protein